MTDAALDRVAACADLLARARLERIRLPALPRELKPQSEDESYRVQFAVHEQLSAAGFGRRRGWKIGCTTAVMQSFLDIPSPCGGGMFDLGIHRGHARYALSALHKPGVECEIAVRLGRSLPPMKSGHDAASVAPAVAAVMAAMEVVDERFVDFRAPEVDAYTLIAEDFFHVGAVLGPEVEDWRAIDLGALAGHTWIAGEPRGSGRGADVMGHPLAALAWLANRLGEFDIALREGDIVLTGSVVATQYPDGPAEAVTEIEGLGRVICAFV